MNRDYIRRANAVSTWTGKSRFLSLQGGQRLVCP